MMAGHRYWHRLHVRWRFVHILLCVCLYLVVVSLSGGGYFYTALWFFPLLLLVRGADFMAREAKAEIRKPGA